MLTQQHLYKKGICVTHLGQQMSLFFCLSQSGEGRLILVDVSMDAAGDRILAMQWGRVSTPRHTFVVTCASICYQTSQPYVS